MLQRNIRQQSIFVTSFIMSVGYYQWDALDQDLTQQDRLRYREVLASIERGNVEPDGTQVDIQPEGLKITLKLHQRRMIHEMLRTEDLPYRVSSGVNMGIISDKVGSGKSLIVLALIALKRRIARLVPNIMNRHHSPTQRPSFSSWYWQQNNDNHTDFIGYQIEPTREYRTNLIVVPHNVFTQWKGYVIKHTSLKFKSVGNVRDLRNFDLNTLDTFDLVLVKSTKFDTFMRMIHDSHRPEVIETDTLPEAVRGFRDLLRDVNRHRNIAYNSLDALFLADMQRIASFCRTLDIGTLLKDFENERIVRLFRVIFTVLPRQVRELYMHLQVQREYDALLQTLARQRQFLERADEVLLRVKLIEQQIKERIALFNRRSFPVGEGERITAYRQIMSSIMHFGEQEDAQEVEPSPYNSNLRRLRTLRQQAARFLNEHDLTALANYVATTDPAAPPLYRLRTYRGPVFDRVIIDEANSIRLSQVRYKRESAVGKFLWCVTSSVQDLLNPCGRLEDGKWIHGIDNKGYLRDLVVENTIPCRFSFLPEIFLRNSDACVDASFQLPEPIRHIIRCLTPPELTILHGNALPRVIHALNAGDEASAISRAGCSRRTETDIVDKILGRYLEQATALRVRDRKYNEALNRGGRIVTETGELKRFSPSERRRIEASRDQVRQKVDALNERIESIRERITNVQSKSCPVCLCEPGTPALVPCCNQVFCFECVANSLVRKPACPLCRASLDIGQICVYDNDSTTQSSQDDASSSEELPTKIAALLGILRANPAGKVLVFSEYRTTFKNIAIALKAENISFGYLKGHSGHIQNTIAAFSAGHTQVLMLDAKFFGAGLNLEMTTDIVIAHRMAKDLERQVIGRGQRLGRTAALRIHYLCYDTEIEVENAP